jgi:predicted porin
MRKILLGTTAVVGAALIGATTAQAQTAPTVRVGGFMLGEITYQTDDLDRARGVPTGVAGRGVVARQRTDFKNELEVQVFVNGKAANGLAYGAVIEMQNDGTGGSIIDIDEAYIFVSSPTLGTIRFGEEDSAASLLQVRHPSITGMGTDGDWGSSLLSSAAFTGGGPSLLVGINDGNDSTKIIYLSPQFFGFDFGVSFSPNRNEGDRVIGARAVDSITVTAGSALVATPPQRDGSGLTNELSGAIRYRGTFGNVGFSAGFGAQRADAPRVSSTTGLLISPRARDVTAYTVGAQLTAFGFTFGGEYTWGRYAGNVATGAQAAGLDQASHWALGLTYVLGAWSFGGFYGIAQQDNGAGLSDREQTVWGIGLAYTLAPGLELFGSYSQMEDKNVRITLSAAASPTGVAGTLVSRDAEVFLGGIRLAF